MSTGAFARLAFGPSADAATIQQAIAAAGSDVIDDLSALRRMLAVVEGHVTPSPVTVRLGAADVEWARVGDLWLAVDSADVSVSRTLLAGTYEPHVTKVFTDFCKPGMTVIDVGANIGYYALLAAHLVGPGGRVVAFEPNSENCRLLLTSVSRNQISNVTLFALAAAERRGWAYFGAHLGSNGAFLADGDKRLLEWPGSVVATLPLDDVVEGPVHLMKFDVEGVEPLVVDGAKRVIEESRPLVVSEFAPGMQASSCGRGGEDYLNWFIERDYRVLLLEPDTARRSPVQPAELLTSPHRLDDVLFVPVEFAGGDALE